MCLASTLTCFLAKIGLKPFAVVCKPFAALGLEHVVSALGEPLSSDRLLPEASWIIHFLNVYKATRKGKN